MSKNKITIEVTDRIKKDLEALVASGLFGFDVPEAAERLIAESLRRIEKEKRVLSPIPPS